MDTAGENTTQILFEALASAATPPGAPKLGAHLVLGPAAERPAWFAVSELATAAFAAAGAALRRHAEPDVAAPEIAVDPRLASLWFKDSFAPEGWENGSLWDPFSGDYRTADGWIRLHTNAAHHRAAALRCLGLDPESASREQVVAAVADAAAEVLEAAVVTEGGAAAAMRTRSEWTAHPAGKAIARQRLGAWEKQGEIAARPGDVDPARPLAGLRVLDLTRVLAGPAATRFLAGYGATVLRIDPPFWSEPAVEPEMTLGKRCAGLDLRQTGDRRSFERLLGEADLLVHGYRDGALDGLGYDTATRRRLNPGLVEVSLNAYGWEGPWRGRRGFDSLVQMSSGVAEYGMRMAGADKPTPLPVQALDHAAGYLLAASALAALAERRRTGAVYAMRTSLAAMSELLWTTPRQADRGEPEVAEVTGIVSADLSDAVESAHWGPLRRVRFPLTAQPPQWRRPAGRLRSSLAQWDD